MTLTVWVLDSVMPTAVAVFVPSSLSRDDLSLLKKGSLSVFVLVFFLSNDYCPPLLPLLSRRTLPNMTMKTQGSIPLCK